MRIGRLLSQEDPFECFKYRRIDIRITDKEGNLKLFLEDCEFPDFWSQTACDTLAYYFFRKNGVPAALRKRRVDNVPDWLCPSEPDWEVLNQLPEDKRFGPEKSAKQVALRLAGFWTYWGWILGYFTSEIDAKNFFDEVIVSFLGQYACPNSPQLLNSGLWWAYGISKKEEGFYIWDYQEDKVSESECAYKNPSVSACYILGVEDSLTRSGGIYDLLQTEAKIFKFGSGSGVNFSSLRSKAETIFSGARSSGAVEFLKLTDYSAGCIKSGGIDRGSSKMAVLDISHPDIEDFVTWKAVHEAGNIVLKNLKDFTLKSGRFEQLKNRLTELGISFDRIFHDPGRIPGQNTNVSVRITEDFMKAVEADRDWTLVGKSGKEVATVNARRLWNLICACSWFCGDPGIQFKETINRWNTCKADGEIMASNPCGEFLFLNNTSCNLASLNVKKFFAGEFSFEKWSHLVRIWTIVLDISVSAGQYPSPAVAKACHDYRTLGLGVTNLGALLMSLAVPYDSDAGRLIAASILASLTAGAYYTSAELAEQLGEFPRFTANRESFLEVMNLHKSMAERTLAKADRVDSESLSEDLRLLIKILLTSAREHFDRGISIGKFRNAQVSCVAPTGTISLLMDCDTTGIEPEFSIVKIKKLRGGGVIKICNSSFLEGLKRLGYSRNSIEEIEQYVTGHKTLAGAPFINHSSLLEKGFTTEDLDLLESMIMNHNSVRELFAVKNLDSRLLKNLGLMTDAELDPNQIILSVLGFSDFEIDSVDKYVYGHNTLKGAPNLRSDHLKIFQVSNSEHSQERISVDGHILMLAECQPFVSGGISKTVNLVESASLNDVHRTFWEAWRLGVKSLTVYRDNSKSGQPLTVRNYDPLNPNSGLSRRPLPARRTGFTQKVRIGGQKIYLRTGEYEDGSLGEIFIDISKEGAAFRSIMNHFAIAVSIGLQYGVPLEEFVDAFVYTKYEPSGPVIGSEYIKTANSISDYIFRELAIHYLGRHEYAQNSGGNDDVSELIRQELSPPQRGFEGEPCLECGNFTLVRSGNCLKCVYCGYSTGCN